MQYNFKNIFKWESQRLYIKIYLLISISLASLILFSFAAIKFIGLKSPFEHVDNIANTINSSAFPLQTQTRQIQQEALSEIVNEIIVSVSLYSYELKYIANVGELLPVPTQIRHNSQDYYLDDDFGFIGEIIIENILDEIFEFTFQYQEQINKGRSAFRWEAGQQIWALPLNDGRIIVYRFNQIYNPIFALFYLGLIATLIGVIAYPVTKGIVARLETLKKSVDGFGSGNFSARVKIKGKDEIALLGDSFNAAAQKIENLIQAQKDMLANASHELRSPLARMRIAFELYSNEIKEKTNLKDKQEIINNIKELDNIINEILISTGINAQKYNDKLAMLNLSQCIKHETQYFSDIETSIEDDIIAMIEPKLIARLCRNLIENAYRYGKPPIFVQLKKIGHNAVFCVYDKGQKIEDKYKDKIFEPFFRLPGHSEIKGGVGIGLALVKQVAQIHKAQINVIDHDIYSKGFQVKIPLQNNNKPIC